MLSYRHTASEKDLGPDVLSNQYQHDKQEDIQGVVPGIVLEQDFVRNFAPMDYPADKSPWVRKQGHNDDFTYKIFHVFVRLN